jgi:fucose 4-O-acetylase-like acetyltransferase
VTPSDTFTTADVVPQSGTVSAQGRADSPTGGRPHAARDPFFDNAKFLLVVLVVVGHNWYPLIWDSRAVKAAYMVVYAFHMPAFTLVSGHFSRRFEARPEQISKLIKTVLVPYFIFQVCYQVVSEKTSGQPIKIDLTYPSYVCWFLVALFAWRLTTPLWRAVPRPLLIAVAVSVCAGAMNATTDFAFSRILEFLPWFVAGLLMKPEHFRWLRRRSVRICAAGVALAALPVSYLLAPGANVQWLDNEWGIDKLGVGLVEYVGIRLALFAASALMVGAVLSLIPDFRLWFTALGAATMYPYLLHGMIVRVGQWSGVHAKVADSGPPAVVALTLGAVALALLLATPPVRRVARWAVEPSLPGRRR